jgi:uncharacterized protein (TIGR02453 family)
VTGEFTGFSAKVFSWFDGLEDDNSKEYFTANRETFETAVKGQLEALLEELTEEFGGEVKMFRQNRDVRFSNDKSPYKTNTYGVIYGGKIAGEGLYVSVSASGMYAGSGYHMLAKDQLARMRDAIANDTTGPALAKAVAGAEEAGLDIGGERLATAPRGYPKDHARIELLRLKQLVAGKALPGGKGGIKRDKALEHVSATWHGAAPITQWLDTNVGPSTIPMDEMRRRR